MRRLTCAFVLALLIPAVRLFAAAPVYTNNFSSVTLDGVRLGTDLDPSNYSMFPSVVYDPQSGLFHMWVAATSALSIEGLRHATSSDGVHFISDGNLSFAGGNPFPIYGAAVEPQFEFPRAARVGTDWKLLIWTENGAPGQFGDYNYNESVNDIGIDPSTLAVAHQGPVYPTNGTGTYGQTTGPFGMIGNNLYVADDRPGGISKWAYNDTTPPSVDTPADHYQDLITGTGYVYFLTHPGDPLAVYVHNVGRVLDQGDGTLGVYYSLRHPDGSRVNKQIYYSQSGDNGQSWSAPVGIFSNGDAVRVDGAPNAFNFSHPEVTLVGARRILYFSTKAADGKFVVATSAAQPPQPGSWADLLGSSQRQGESAVAVTRTSDGGHAILAQSRGFAPDNPSFWLVKLDGSGEVVSQTLYTAPNSGPGPANTFFPTALAQGNDGGFLMAGLFTELPTPMWLLRVDAFGNVVWSKTYTTCDGGLCGNLPLAIVPTSDGGFAFAGSGNSYARFVLGKVDGSGALQWYHSYPVAGLTTVAVSLVATPDGGFAVGGSIGSSGADYRVLKTDASGAISWDEQIGSTGSDALTGLSNSSSGTLLVTGKGPGGSAQVVALDADGNISWQKSYTGGELSLVHGIASTEGGGAGIAGSGVDGRAILFGIDGTGAVQWSRAFAAMTTSHASFGPIAPTFDGGFVAAGVDTDPTVSYSRVLAVRVDPGGNFVGCLDVAASFPITVSTPSLTTTALASTVVDELANTTTADLAATETITDANERVVCRATLPADLTPTALAADPPGNGVADPGELFVAAPSWSNFGLLATTLTGHSSALSDSNGLDTANPDPDADYGLVASLVTADCLTATGNCYQFGFRNIPRPSQHWDTYFDETLSTADPHHKWAKRWTVHAGLSFSDVSPSSGFYPFIEDIFHNGITGGCGAGIYCPTASVTRAQMAVFLLKSKHGASFTPPACAGIFGDVACPSLYANWIEELYAEGVTAGCGTSPLLYCPNDPVTRQQMAAFLLKALNGSGYTPPAAAGIFGDVPLSNPFAPWVEDLYNRQITAGCSASPLLYCPADANTREQMAVFLTKTFSLVLYGP